MSSSVPIAVGPKASARLAQLADAVFLEMIDMPEIIRSHILAHCPPRDPEQHARSDMRRNGS